MDSYDREMHLSFRPPLFRQRYLAVQNLLYNEKLEGKIHKVVDFGCAELKFFIYLKNIQSVEEILEVDVDVDILTNNVHKIQPLLSDYLVRRSRELNVSVLEGNIKDPDPRLIDTDMVVCIEVIEHLYPDTLEAVPYNIFEFVRPNVAVFTTPNADFNILFPSFKGIRHYDHKFEWTREQFEDWAHNIITRFPDYSVVFDGVGELPTSKQKNLGYCSQIAIFYLNCKSKCELDDNNDYKSYGICTYESYNSNTNYTGFNDEKFSRPCYFKPINQIQYPYDDSPESPLQNKIHNEITYLLNVYGTEWGLYFNYEKQQAEIPISFFCKNLEHLCASHDELLTIIKKKYETADCLIENSMVECIIHCVKDEDDDDTEDEDSNNDVDEDEDEDVCSKYYVNW